MLVKFIITFICSFVRLIVMVVLVMVVIRYAFPLRYVVAKCTQNGYSLRWKSKKNVGRIINVILWKKYMCVGNRKKERENKRNEMKKRIWWSLDDIRELPCTFSIWIFRFFFLSFVRMFSHIKNMNFSKSRLF